MYVNLLYEIFYKIIENPKMQIYPNPKVIIEQRIL